MTEPSYDACLVEAELRARSTYSEPHRRYHDERHLAECLTELDWVRGLTARQSRLLRWAILWHDSIYDPGQRNNEERSAELAHMELTRCGVPPEEADEVARLIRATEFHRADPGDELGRLIVSIDLSILGAHPNRYREYAADVRNEYPHLGDAMWRTGRAVVLRRLLDAERIYPDEDFRKRLETQARDNMEAELRELGEG
jgi:predicted metal-dependent HD superfamily phosphohydrolase